MPVVILKCHGSILKKYQIDVKKSLSIGRRNANDIVIDTLGVSGHHAKIESIADYFVLADMQSKNGTVVNGRKVRSHHLKSGDRIFIGKHELLFENGEIGKTEEDVDNLKHSGEMRKEPDKISAASESSPQTNRLGLLKTLTGKKDQFELSKKVVKIGKDSSSDIVVDGFLMGKTAATINRKPNGYILEYVNGLPKPKVNKNTVKNSVRLYEFDMVEIGSLKMQFIYKS